MTRSHELTPGHAPLTSERSLPRWVAWPVFVVCGAWLLAIGILWVVTGKTVPTINVRWAASVTSQQRVQTERELSIVLREPQRDRTGIYFVPQADKETLKKIVLHPLVEDTAFVGRRTFELEHAPSARMWLGDRYRFLKRSDLMYLSALGCLIASAVLLLPSHHVNRQGT